MNNFNKSRYWLPLLRGKRTKSVINVLLIVTVVCLFQSCEYDVPTSNETVIDSQSELSFDSFYTIGGIHTSGFMDGALYDDAQKFSYPNLLITQIDSFSTESYSFTQASIGSENGFNLENESATNGKFKLVYKSLSRGYPSRVPSEGDLINNWEGDENLLNDYSFPGLRIHEFNGPTVNIENDYYNRLGGNFTSIVDRVIPKNPSLIVLDLGSDDLLNYALNGASGNENPVLNSIQDKDLVTAADFESILTGIVNSLLNNTEANIFLATAINPLNAPFFTTIDWAIEFDDYGGIEYFREAEQHYIGFNELITQHNFYDNGALPLEERRNFVNFFTDSYCEVLSPYCPKPFHLDEVNRGRVIEDEYLDNDVLNSGEVIPKYRQLVEGEIVLYDNLPSLNKESQLSGIIPLDDSQAITSPEIEIINNRVESFNSSIRSIANSNERVILIDLNAVVSNLENESINFDSIIYSSKFDQYSVYSSDGYSFNRRGQAILANEFIKKINELNENKMPLINPNQFKGNDVEVES